MTFSYQYWPCTVHPPKKDGVLALEWQRHIINPINHGTALSSNHFVKEVNSSTNHWQGTKGHFVLPFPVQWLHIVLLLVRGLYLGIPTDAHPLTPSRSPTLIWKKNNHWQIDCHADYGTKWKQILLSTNFKALCLQQTRTCAYSPLRFMTFSYQYWRCSTQQTCKTVVA